MKFFGWRPLFEDSLEYWEWVPRVEQVEIFPDQEVGLDFLGTNGYLDNESSVSAVVEGEECYGF